MRNYLSKKLIFRVYFNWGNSKCISIVQNKYCIPSVLALIWKDPISLFSITKRLFFRPSPNFKKGKKQGGHFGCKKSAKYNIQNDIREQHLNKTKGNIS